MNDSSSHFLDFDLRAAFYRHKEGAFLDFLHLPEQGKVLDVGCGEGFLAEFVSKHLPETQARIVGVDISTGSLRVAKSHSKALELHASYAAGDGSKLCFKENTFDAAVVHTCLKYVQDPAMVLQEVLRVVETGTWVTVADRILPIRVDFGIVMTLLYTIYQKIMQRKLGKWDAKLAQRLPQLLAGAGLEEITITSFSNYIHTRDPILKRLEHSMIERADTVWSRFIVKLIKRCYCRIIARKSDAHALDTMIVVRGIKKPRPENI